MVQYAHGHMRDEMQTEYVVGTVKSENLDMEPTTSSNNNNNNRPT